MSQCESMGTFHIDSFLHLGDNGTKELKVHDKIRHTINRNKSHDGDAEIPVGAVSLRAGAV